jgi:hypothetical protein
MFFLALTMVLSAAADESHVKEARASGANAVRPAGNAPANTSLEIEIEELRQALKGQSELLRSQEDRIAALESELRLERTGRKPAVATADSTTRDAVSVESRALNSQ